MKPEYDDTERGWLEGRDSRTAQERMTEPKLTEAQVGALHEWYWNHQPTHDTAIGDLTELVAGWLAAAEQTARAEVVNAVEAELRHAHVNGHILDRDCQGVGPGERVPAVRVANVRAAIGATS